MKLSLRPLTAAALAAIALSMASAQSTLGSLVGKDLAAYKKVRGMKVTTTKDFERVMQPGKAYADDEIAKLPLVEVVYFKGAIAKLGEISGRQTTKEGYVRDWELIFSGSQPKTWRDALTKIGLKATNVRAKERSAGGTKWVELSGTIKGGGWTATFTPKNADFNGRGTFEMKIRKAAVSAVKLGKPG